MDLINYRQLMAEQKDHDAAKLERVLLTHSLEGLVFEKRERKQTSNPFLQITPALKKTNKVGRPKKQVKREKLQEKQADGLKLPSDPHPKLQKHQQGSQIEAATKPRKPLGRPKNLYKKIKQSNPNDETVNKPQKTVEEGVKKSPADLEKKIVVADKKGNKGESAHDKRENNDGSNNERQPIKLKSDDVESLEKNLPLKIQKVKKATVRSVRKASRAPVDESEEVAEQKMSQKDSEKESGNQRDSEIDDPNAGEQVATGRRHLRARKSKGEAMKKFTMLEDMPSEEDNEEPYNDPAGKKKSNRNIKDYQINRIFRKSHKVRMPAVTLDADVGLVNFEQFSAKFGTFDMIHYSLPLEMLAKSPQIKSCMTNGFIFVWVQKGEIQAGYHILNRLGFDVIDQIMWVKTNQTMSEMAVQAHQGGGTELFQNCRETCLIGYKCSATHRTEYCTKISNNIIFSPERPASSLKPDEIYQIADLMMPGARKLQIGGKNIGGWLSLIHHETSLLRCYNCFRKHQLSLLIVQRSPGELKLQLQCESCMTSQSDKEKERPEQLEEQKQVEENEGEKEPQNIIRKIKVYDFFPQPFNVPLVCSQCRSDRKEQLIKLEFDLDINVLACAECTLKMDNLEGCPQVTIMYRSKTYLPSVQIACQFCQSSPLFQYYFESTKGKINRYICCNCMSVKVPILSGKDSDSNNQGSEDSQKDQKKGGNQEEKVIQKESEGADGSSEGKSKGKKSNSNESGSQPESESKEESEQKLGKKKTDNEPEWKLRAILEAPEVKSNCFSCREDCMIPYFGCEVCQNWYWCGRCEVVNKQHHSHSCRQHSLHLII